MTIRMPRPGASTPSRASRARCTRIPRQFAPYHLRLDWLMWFLPLGRSLDDWFTAFLVKLLEADPATLRLLARDPFDGVAPGVGARGVLPLPLHDARAVPPAAPGGRATGGARCSVRCACGMSAGKRRTPGTMDA